MNENELPALITSEFQAPVSDVDVWLNASRLVHVTVSPTRIGAVAGANAEFWMFTELVAVERQTRSGTTTGALPERRRELVAKLEGVYQQLAALDEQRAPGT